MSLEFFYSTSLLTLGDPSPYTLSMYPAGSRINENLDRALSEKKPIKICKMLNINAMHDYCIEVGGEWGE